MLIRREIDRNKSVTFASVCLLFILSFMIVIVTILLYSLHIYIMMNVVKPNC